MPQTIAAYAAQSATESLAPFSISRRDPLPDDVCIDILFCGVCHTDLHTARNDWGSSRYPVVPGHEIVGRVASVGNNVKKFKHGDLVAVGCLVDSCKVCASCDDGLEQYCESGIVATYNSVDPRSSGAHTFGGYSKHIVVREDFVLSVPENLELAAAAPLLCAGITVWSPLRHHKVGPGMTIGVIGLGGLGHMGVKLASALGANVVMITTSPEKGEDAKRLGADQVLISSDENEMQQSLARFDLLLDTIPVKHDLNHYLPLLKLNGTLVIVGAIEPMESFHSIHLLLKRRNIAGSLIGGIKETQEMLDFCGKHNIVSDIELIKISEINTAYERMEKSDVKYRFVIDIGSLID